MFAADAQFDIRSGLPSQFSCHLNQFSHALLIQMSEWGAFKDLLFVVIREESARIITREAIGHLGQIIGAE